MSRHSLFACTCMIFVRPVRYARQGELSGAMQWNKGSASNSLESECQIRTDASSY